MTCSHKPLSKSSIIPHLNTWSTSHVWEFTFAVTPTYSQSPQLFIHRQLMHYPYPASNFTDAHLPPPKQEHPTQSTTNHPSRKPQKPQPPTHPSPSLDPRTGNPDSDPRAPSAPRCNQCTSPCSRAESTKSGGSGDPRRARRSR